jgi:WD40 repeat protein
MRYALPLLIAVNGVLLTCAATGLTACAQDARPEGKRLTDGHGDPLPPGALARLGSVRLRGVGGQLAFSPDGKVLASGGWDHPPFYRGLGWGLQKGQPSVVHFWDPATGRELWRAGLHAKIRALAFSADGGTLATCGDEPEVVLWNPTTGHRLDRLATAAGPSGVACSADGRWLAASTASNVVHVWKLPAKDEVYKLSVPDVKICNVNRLTFSPDSKLLASANNHKQGLCLWDLATGKLRHHLLRGEAVVWSAAFSKDGKLVVAACAPQTVRAFDVATGKLLWQAEHKAGALFRAAVFPDGKTVASTGSGGILLWDAATGRELGSLTGGEKVVELTFSPDGKTVAWVSHNSIRLVDVATRKETVAVGGSRGPVEWVGFSPDGKTAAVGGDRLYLFEAATGKERPGEAPPVAVAAGAFAPDGRTLVIGDPGQTIRLCDARTGKELRSFVGEPGVVEFLAFLPRGDQVVSMSRHRMVKQGDRSVSQREDKLRIWDVATGKEVRQVALPGMRCALTPDGLHGSSGFNLLDLPSGKLVEKVANKSMVFAVALSGDGRRVAVARLNGEFFLWEAATGAVLHHLKGHQHAVVAAAFSPNGRLLASAGADHTVRLWDVETGKELRCLVGHQAAVLCVAFSPDGRRLLSGSADTTALVWDVADVVPAVPRPKG